MKLFAICQFKFEPANRIKIMIVIVKVLQGNVINWQENKKEIGLIVDNNIDTHQLNVFRRFT